MFPVPKNRTELANKAWVIGVIVNGVAKAYDVKKFKNNKKIKDKIGKKEIIIAYDKTTNHPQVMNKRGKEIPSVLVYWFAWQAFYPNTELR